MPSPAGTASATAMMMLTITRKPLATKCLRDLAEVFHERLRHGDGRRQDVALHQHGDDLPDRAARSEMVTIRSRLRMTRALC